jgi:putative phosphoribosyl transferase
MPFLDRCAAGRRLAERLRVFGDSDAVVLGLPRGGVPVAYEVATALHLPLDIAVVRKLTVPYRPWLVFGAVGEAGVRIINDEIVVRAFVTEPEILLMVQQEREELRRNVTRYRSDRAPLPLDGRTALIVDDGVATGATAHAACAIARARGATRIVFATPVGACRPVRALSTAADHIVCLETPELFHSIAPWYRDFRKVTHTQTRALLDQAAQDPRTHPRDPAQSTEPTPAP